MRQHQPDDLGERRFQSRDDHRRRHHLSDWLPPVGRGGCRHGASWHHCICRALRLRGERRFIRPDQEEWNLSLLQDSFRDGTEDKPAESAAAVGDH